MAAQRIVHPLKPVFAADSRILLLGTMPSPKSRANGFYYGHPQNRFWRVLAAVLSCQTPETVVEKKELLLSHYIALWDVLRACCIQGADDASIRQPEANDIAALLQQTKIQAVFTTGQKAFALHEKLVYPQTGMHAICLPSTSPANCRCSFEALVQAYSCMKEYLR